MLLERRNDYGKEREKMSVTVYSTPACVYCNLVKKYLKSKNVRYTDIDITVDAGSVEEMVAKSRQRGVPVIDFDGTIIVGFDTEQIDRLL